MMMGGLAEGAGLGAGLAVGHELVEGLFDLF
jgi:hypothetical protein